MKARSIVIGLIFISLFGLGLSCSKEDLGIIPNAFIKCPTNDSCEAKCYRGYIFPDGNTATEYSCQNGDWTPVSSACKRVPIIHTTYAAIWQFSIIPSECDNITIRLNASKEMLEKEILTTCNVIPINMNVYFTFQTLAVQVTTTFSAEYTNFTKKKDVETCSSVIVVTFANKNIPLFNNLFHNITCENQPVNYTVFKNISISDQYEQCPTGMDVRNITATTSEEQYCDYAVTVSSSKSVTNAREQTTAPPTDIQDTTTLSKDQTDLNYDTTADTTFPDAREQTTAPPLSIQDTTTLSKERTDLKDDTTVVTSFPKNDESTVGLPVVNSSSELVKNRLTVNVVYIGASAGGATVLIVLVIVVVVCRKKSSDTSDGHLKTLEMKEYASDDSFKGELIENVFYQSADDFDNEGKNDNSPTSTQDNEVMYSTAKSTNKTERCMNSGVENSNQGYSLKPVDETAINDGSEAEMADKLKCDAPIVKDCKDSDQIHLNTDEYAVVNKSDKHL